MKPFPTNRRPSIHSRRGSAMIAVILVLVVLQFIVLGIVVSGSRDNDSSNTRLAGVQAFYSAEGVANMALREIYVSADEDGDGGIGTISNDNNSSTDPTFNAATRGWATKIASGGTTTVTAKGQNTGAARALQIQLAVATGVGGFEAIEDFETYNAGTALNNVGGWEAWDANPGAVGYASNVMAHSGTMSQDIQGPTDSVHQYTPTSGKWIYAAWQYIPSTATGAGAYFIMMNTYAPGGGKGWSTQVYFDLGSNTLYDNMTGITGNQLPIVRDQWVPIVVNLDLDAGTESVMYNSNLLFNASWNRQGGARAFAAVDLYGNGVSHVYYDDIQLAPVGASKTTVVGWKAVDPTP